MCSYALKDVDISSGVSAKFEQLWQCWFLPCEYTYTATVIISVHKYTTTHHVWMMQYFVGWVEKNNWKLAMVLYIIERFQQVIGLPSNTNPHCITNWL